MTKNTKRTLNPIAPPPPPPPHTYIRLLNRCVVVSPKTACSLRQTFLAKIPKLTLFSAFWDKKAAPSNRQKFSSAEFFSTKARRFFHNPRRLSNKPAPHRPERLALESAPLNRKKSASRFFIHAASPICLAVLGLFLFTHCYKGGGRH